MKTESYAQTETATQQQHYVIFCLCFLVSRKIYIDAKFPIFYTFCKIIHRNIILLVNQFSAAILHYNVAQLCFSIINGPVCIWLILREYFRYLQEWNRWSDEVCLMEQNKIIALKNGPRVTEFSITLQWLLCYNCKNGDEGNRTYFCFSLAHYGLIK